MGSGCGTVGRAGTFKTGGPGFEYIHQHKQTLWAVVVAHLAQQSRRTPEGLGLNPSIGIFIKNQYLLQSVLKRRFSGNGRSHMF